MSGSQVFVLLIIAIVFGSGLLRSWMGKRQESSETDGEANEMLEKIEVLEERIRVLERIVTENKIDLKQEIDRL